MKSKFIKSGISKNTAENITIIETNINIPPSKLSVPLRNKKPKRYKKIPKDGKIIPNTLYL